MIAFKLCTPVTDSRINMSNHVICTSISLSFYLHLSFAYTLFSIKLHLHSAIDQVSSRAFYSFAELSAKKVPWNFKEMMQDPIFGLPLHQKWTKLLSSVRLGVNLSSGVFAIFVLHKLKNKTKQTTSTTTTWVETYSLWLQQ